MNRSEQITGMSCCLWPGQAVFIVVWFLLLLLPFESRAITLPPVPITSECTDNSTALLQYVVCVNRYGGNGVEPMLDVSASLLDLHPNDSVSRSGSASLYSLFSVQARGSLPAGYNGELIPISFMGEYEASVTYLPNAYGSVFVRSRVDDTGNGGTFFEVTGTADWNNPSIAGSGSSSRGVPLGTTMLVWQQVDFYLFNDVLQGTQNNGSGATEVQAIVDPFIFVDPTWEYAPYFAVYGQDGIEVTRDWMAVVPLPGSAVLFLSGGALLSSRMFLRRKSARRA